MKPVEEALRDRQSFFPFFFSPEVCQEPTLVGRSWNVNEERWEIAPGGNNQPSHVGIVGSGPCSDEPGEAD
jgi:hypothetical protein